MDSNHVNVVATHGHSVNAAETSKAMENAVGIPIDPIKLFGGKRVYAQDVVDDYVRTLRDAYTELEDKLSSTLAEKLALENLFELEQAAHIVSKTELEQKSKAISSAMEEYKKVESEVAADKQKISLLENSISELERKLEEKSTALRVTKRELEDASTIITEFRRRETMLSEEVKSLEEENAELKTHQYEVFDIPGGDAVASLIPTSTGMTAQYVSLLDRVQAAANSYTYDVQQRADEMLSQAEHISAEQLANAKSECEEMISAAKARAETILREAAADATGITQTASIDADIIRKKAEETMKVTQQRVEEARNNARKELADIRALITQAGAEYLEISSNKAQDSDLFDE